DETRIRESALESTVLLGKRGTKTGQVSREDFNTAGIDGEQTLFAAQDVQRGTALGAGLSQHQRTVVKVEGCQPIAAGKLGLRRLPMQAAGNHEVEHQPQVAVDADGDALADATEGPDGAPFHASQWWIGGAQQKHRANAHVFERLAEDARFERGD